MKKVILFLIFISSLLYGKIVVNGVYLDPVTYIYFDEKIKTEGKRLSSLYKDYNKMSDIEMKKYKNDISDLYFGVLFNMKELNKTISEEVDVYTLSMETISRFYIEKDIDVQGGVRLINYLLYINKNGTPKMADILYFGYYKQGKCKESIKGYRYIFAKVKNVSQHIIDNYERVKKGCLNK